MGDGSPVGELLEGWGRGRKRRRGSSVALGKSQVGPAGPAGKSITSVPHRRKLRPREGRGLTEGAEP